MGINNSTIVFSLIWILTFLFEVVLKYLNIRHIKDNKDSVIRKFTGRLDKDKYEQAIDYSTTNSNFSIITGIIDLVILLALIFFGIFDYLDQMIRSFGLGDVGTGTLFFTLIYLLSETINIPQQLYSVFVIEERFGFNTQNMRLWIIDFFKSLLINIIIITIISSVILLFIKKAGDIWWIIAWGFLFIFSLTIQFIYPVFIAPLFNKFEELPEGELNDRIKSLARRTDFKIKNIFTMDASKRSKHSNAYFAGFGKSKRVILFDTLIKNHTTDEIEAVLAHEIGHYKYRHILKTTLILQGITLLSFYILSHILLHPELFKIFRVQTPGAYSGLFISGYLFSIVKFWTSPLFMSFLRSNEKEADRFALFSVKKKEIFRSLFIKLSMDNLSALTPHDIYANFYYSHPPILKRLKYIEELEVT